MRDPWPKLLQGCSRCGAGMITVETAVRAWVQPTTSGATRRNSGKRAYRKAAFDDRVLVFDTETTTDFALRLQFGIYRLYVAGILEREGIFYGDSSSDRELEIIRSYGRKNEITVISRAEFVEKVFFHYVYGLGALCVGFNLPFDLSRIAIRAGIGRGQNRRKFRLTLTTKTLTYSALHIEAISGRAAFIGFAKRNNLADWEKPYFKGRFLDLSTLATALTGERFSLKRAAITFKTDHKKSETSTLGIVTPETIDYGRNDVLVTWELFEKLRDEYALYPFATMANERSQPIHSKPVTRIYSTASVAKATLVMMGFIGQVPDDDGETP